MASRMTSSTGRRVEYPNEIDAEEAPEAELEYGVDDEGRCTLHDLEEGNPERVAIAMRLTIPFQFFFFQTQK